jgi:uncharacterized membrane protein
MTSLVFAAVLCSSFLQASWNFLAKKSDVNKTALLLVGWLMFGLVSLPISILVSDFSNMSSVSWSLLFCSGLIHFLYVLVLGWAYTVGDISVVYPIARGLGIALTTFIASQIGIDQITFIGGLGVLTVVFGTLVLASKEMSNVKNAESIKVSILVACVISSYSLVDSVGAQTIPPLFFVAMMNLITGLLSLPLLFGRYKEQALLIIKSKKREAFFIAFSGSAAYLIVLWAYTQTQTAYVVALREFSIVVASFLGLYVLKERLHFNKALGVLLILLGVFLVRFS